jgi:hypothetical protein
VDAGVEDKVQLVLDGASVSCADGPAIYVKNAGRCFVAGRRHGKHDVGRVGLRGHGRGRADAAVYSEADLQVNGSGTLEVTANAADGIVSKDELVIAGGSLVVTAADDALRGTDSVAVCAAR